jgi:hypothetical protein
MLGTGRPEQTADDGVLADTKPACVALVPMARSVGWSHTARPQLSRPDSTFITHLIATAERAPQTRSLRRATPADAQTAYRANRPVQAVGIRTRQTI